MHAGDTTRGVMKRTLSLMTVCLAMVWAGTAMGVTLGNPISGLQAGQKDLGIQYSDHHTDLLFDYGVTNAGAAQVFLGNTDYEGLSGSEWGLGYRHDLGPKFKLDKYDAHLGVFGFYRKSSGSQTGWKIEYTELALGTGAMIKPAEKLQTYANLAYVQFKTETTVDVPTLEFVGGVPTVTTKSATYSDTESKIGLVVGADYAVTPELTAGGALNMGFDDDDSFALFGRFRF